ncbi:MAG: TATA-box-binding protein [Candidatus Methanoperedens sp.]|nr:TATA-box-binding protein [Candidatus Methanoperedens sp.]
MNSWSFKIENVVSTVKLSPTFDLEDLKSKLENAEYDKSKFPGLVYRIKDPKAVFLLFNSGKVVCTGSKSVEDAQTASKKLTHELIRNGLEIDASNEIKVQNIVASAALGSVLNLNSVALGFGMENIEYEPEQFPGLVYRMSQPKVVILLFGSGKMVITGGKSPTDCENAYRSIKEKLTNLNII